MGSGDPVRREVGVRAPLLVIQRSRGVMQLLVVAVVLHIALCGAAAQDAAGLYQKGSFVQSYEAAIRTDTTAAQTLAAQAAVAYALFVAPTDHERVTWFQRGADAAEHAVDRDPSAVPALLVLAQAKGEAALLKGPLQNLGVARETRDLLRRALKLQPNDPNALVGLGVWNLELTDRGVGWMFGARRKGALAMVQRGVEQAPDDIELRTEYARALQLSGDDSESRAQIEFAVRLPAHSALDHLRQQQAAAYLGGRSTVP